MRQVRRVAGIIVRTVLGKLQSFKYTHLAYKDASPSAYVANLLVVKKPIYAKIAKICAESFYYYNPRCKILVHVDSFTEELVEKELQKLIRLGVVQIRRVNSDAPTWQELKLQLVLSMTIDNEFFMDADLRWNGPLPKLNSVTYFVNEFDFDQKSPYSEMVQLPSWGFGSSVSMKNTSFVSWGTYRTTSEDRALIESVMTYINKICLIENQFPHHQDSLIRISEQIALSVLADKIPEKVNFLKSEDGFRDGTFVESSYFGATGSAF